MSDSSSPRLLRRSFQVLLVVASLAGGALLWTQASDPTSDPLSSDAIAAPRPTAPRPTAPQPNAARPKPASAAEKNAAIKSIRGQLHAFDTGDWKGAVAFQSSGLKTNFATPAQFGAMIQHAYPAFIRARRVDFGPALSSGPMLQMIVRLSPRQGEPMQVLYILVKENGQYRISGVQGGMNHSGSSEGHPQPRPDDPNSVVA